MKIINKSLSVVLSIVMLFTLLLLNAFANAEVPGNNLSDEEKYEYTIDENSQTVTITGVKGYVDDYEFKYYVTGDVIIPSELDDYPVTAIGTWAFASVPLTSVFIPETVLEIESEAFRGSQAVISIDENNPYFHCAGNCLIETETKTLIHGNSNSVIPDDGSVTTIGVSAFRDSDLETILIPNTITHIDHYAFSGTNLKQIVIPDSVTSISGYCTFDSCIELESVYIGKGLQSFTSFWRIFAGCNNLKSITVDEENQTFSSQGNCIIDNKTKTLVAGCNNSTIPSDSTIESIGHYAFTGCSELRSITIPDNVKAIKHYAFSECSSLESIFIPKNVTYIEGSVFEDCINLSEIKVDLDNLTYHVIDNCLIHTAQKTLIKGLYNSIIPADGSVEHIGASAFYGQKNLYYLEIPEGVKTIGDSAFCSTSLYMVSLPSTLQRIYSQNFNGIGTLKYILYNGSEGDRENIQNGESWEGQNSDFNRAQWYYNGTKPFEDFVLSASSIECMEYVDCTTCTTWYSGESETWIKYNINPQITITFADNTKFTGTKEEVEDAFGYLVGIYDNQTHTNIWGVGKHTVKVCFLNQSVEIDVTVVEHPVERIEIEDVVLLEETAGYKTEFGYLYYYVTPEYTVFFKDGSQKTVFVDITIGGKPIRLQTNHYSLQHEAPWVAGGIYEVSGSFLNFSDTFTVTIKEKSLTNIAVLSKPDKLTYIAGEPIDTSGMIVAAYYDNGYVERITDYTVSGYDKNLVGKQTVTVSYNDIKTTFNVTVLPINVTGIELDQQEIAFIVGNSANLKATIFPETATNKRIIWQSSDPAIAQVDETGVVTTIKKGTAVITATTEDGAYTAFCSVFVVCPHRNTTTYEAISSSCNTYGHETYTICDICDEITEGSNAPLPLSAHKYTNGCDTSCNVCGAIRTITYTGWYKKTGNWYYYQNGSALKNQWKKDSNGWVYLGSDGTMETNAWVKDSVGWCYVGKNGYIVKNDWVKDGGKWYFLDKNGYMLANIWQKDSYGWCYLGADGAMKTNAWVRDSQGWCYVGGDGYCVTDTWKKDSKGWVYLDHNGRMLTNSWVQDSKGWCYVGANGYCVTNTWKKDSKGWVYLDHNGHMLTNAWVKDSVGWCYVGADGYAVANTWKKDSVGWCYLNANGSMTKSDWVQDVGKWYYLDANGYMVTGKRVISGKTYTFNADGVWVG